MEKLIEGVLPIDVISRDAAIEMSFKPTPSYLARCRELGLTAPGRTFYDPKIRSLLPWSARRSRSAARALNLAALLPAHTPFDEFLKMLGFSEVQLRELVALGYPPLISYAQPAVDNSYINSVNSVVIMDPMGGGGSIPLEAAILGAQTIACDYNPVAFLILRATIEWPAQFGIKLYDRVRDEAKMLIDFAREELGRFYGEADRGYLIVRQVLTDSGITPIAPSIQLDDNIAVLIDGENIRLSYIASKYPVRRDLIGKWIEQHKALMQGRQDLIITHRIVAVQQKRGFRLARNEDQELLHKALRELFESHPELPDTELASDNRIYRKIITLERYKFLFNPRQALVLGKLIDYVRKRTGLLIQQDGEFGAAVATYLAFGLCRIADFNSILTSWNERQGTVRDALGAYYKFRELRLDGIYAEAVVPYRTIEWVFEPDAVHETAGGICPVLRELTAKLHGARNKVQVFMADVLELSRHFQNVADVINVDPPYFDVHRYSDFSEFFWPILRLALKDALPLLFDARILFDWKPTMSRVPRQHEVIGRMAKGEDEFEEKLTTALSEMRIALKDDGLLILWFSHKELKAWQAVSRALQRSGFTIVNVIPLVSEHPTRSITNGGRGGINRVLILVARKANGHLKIDQNRLRERFLEQLEKARLLLHEQISQQEKDFLSAAISVLFNP
jgi:putative DNA methylase